MEQTENTMNRQVMLYFWAMLCMSIAVTCMSVALILVSTERAEESRKVEELRTGIQQLRIRLEAVQEKIALLTPEEIEELKRRWEEMKQKE